MGAQGLVEAGCAPLILSIFVCLFTPSHAASKCGMLWDKRLNIGPME